MLHNILIWLSFRPYLVHVSVKCQLSSKRRSFTTLKLHHFKHEIVFFFFHMFPSLPPLHDPICHYCLPTTHHPLCPTNRRLIKFILTSHDTNTNSHQVAWAKAKIYVWFQKLVSCSILILEIYKVSLK